MSRPSSSEARGKNDNEARPDKRRPIAQEVYELHKRIEGNLKVMSAFDEEHRGKGNEARTISVQGIAAFIASTSTEAELKRLLDRVDPFARRMWWRKALRGKRMTCGGVFGQERRLTASNFHTVWGRAEIDRLVGARV